ncbi:hypothetical protein [Kitasatospora sp. NPDC088346]|uniref:hypothetical protein n=1 Tax=Kitasatospora sp. NPDC088346 TaxID=3364073 RepID=UPI0038198F9C
MSAVHPLVALLISLGAVAVLVLLMQWTYRRGSSLVARRPHAGNPDEYGLLVTVAAPADAAEAARLGGLLTAAGVRHNLVDTTAGARLMVWPGDVERARAALDRR